MRKNLLVKLMFAFIFATTFSAMLSYTLANYVNIKNVVKQFRRDETSIAQTIIKLHNDYGTNTEMLAQQFSSYIYDVKVMTTEEIAEIDASRFEKIKGGEIVTFSKFLNYNTVCMFKVGSDIIRIGLNPQNDIIRSFGGRLGNVMLGTLLLSACLMFFVSSSVTKPIRELHEATKKVATGDFDVHVDVDSENEVGQLAKSFNSMVNELKSNELLKKDFISNVSHEFKTPLATINGFAKLLEDGNCTPEEVHEYAEIIDSETNRLSKLCSNILRLSKIENQNIVKKTSHFRLDEQMRDVLLLLEPQWSAKELELDVELDNAEYTGDEELLQQVWINLMGNAIKFTDNKGKISVSLTSDNKNITVKVKDNGIGMDEETQKHIFEKFYQAERSHSREGNGLGLALVKEIVEMCGGTVEVKSKPGEGSEFTVLLVKSNDK